MKQINGKIIQGLAAASGTKKDWDGHGSIYLQVEFLRHDHAVFASQLDSCVKATININLSEDLFFDHWEHAFDNVFWLPNCITWSERIAFSPIIFEYDGQKTEAWLYKAYRSPHRDNLKLLEVIAPPIERLLSDAACAIYIDECYLASDGE